jgi:CRISPR/Cas system Type II protein with McrA/HNH and RuvC-like nuclease domain
MKIVRRRIDPEERRLMYELSNKRCAYCGYRIGFSEVTIDHKIPLSRGGPDCMDNMVCSCRPCNELKRDRTVEEFRGLVATMNHDMMQQDQRYRAAIRFGLIREHRKKKIVFYFETREAARKKR